MNKKINTTATFNQVLVVTEQLITEKGCNSTTLQDIVNLSGISKGGIYHYVRSKDEIFGLILLDNMTNTDINFVEETKGLGTGIEGPLRAIVNGMTYITTESDVTNEIFIYLLGRKEEPEIADILSNIYEHTLQLSISWIMAGQQANLIRKELDVKQTATKFITYAYGLRVRAMIDTTIINSNTLQEFYNFMLNTLV